MSRPGNLIHGMPSVSQMAPSEVNDSKTNPDTEPPTGRFDDTSVAVGHARELPKEQESPSLTGPAKTRTADQGMPSDGSKADPIDAQIKLCLLGHDVGLLNDDSHRVTRAPDGIRLRELSKSLEKDSLADSVKAAAGRAKEARDQARALLDTNGRPKSKLSDAAVEKLAKVADKLGAQAANARRAIALIFAREEGTLDTNDEKSAAKLSKDEATTNGKRSFELPADKMKLVSDLRRLADDNQRQINALVENRAPTVKLMDDNLKAMSDDQAEMKWTEAKFPALDALETSLNRLIPETLKSSGPLCRNLSGDAAKREMHQLVWNFSKLLKESPDTRLAFGGKLVFANDDELHDHLTAFVSKLRLCSKDRMALKAALLVCIARTVPSRYSVKCFTKLGEGGFGTTYAGTFDVGTVGEPDPRPVIVKVPKSSAPQKQISKNEVNLMHELSLQGRMDGNPNIPRIVGLYYPDSDGLPNIVMERVEGSNMKDFFAKNGAGLGVEGRAKVALHFFAGTARALDDMAQRGFVHRDVKPANIMIDRNTMQARLIDYGGAGPADDSFALAFTAEYACADYDGKGETGVTPQTDIFSLGSTLYRTLGGELWKGLPPEERRNAPWRKLPDQYPGTFDEKLNGADIWPPELQPVRKLIEACWNPVPNDRPTTRQILQAIQGEAVTPAASDGKGLKAGALDALDVLKPDHPLRQDPESVIRDMLVATE